MKRRQLFLVLATALLTTACSSFVSNDIEDETNLDHSDTAPAEATENASEPEEAQEEAQEEVPVVPSVDEQLAIIEKNYDIWKLTEEDREVFSPFTDYGYAIDDLDRDGYLEVIKTFWGGETRHDRTSIYEVTEDGAFAEWNMDAFRELEIEPGIEGLKRVRIIKDATYNVYATEWYEEYWGKNTDYEMTFEDNAVKLREYAEGERPDYTGYEFEKFSWFKDMTPENLKISCEKKYFRDERDTTGLYTAYLNGEAEAIQDITFDKYIDDDDGLLNEDYSIYDYDYIDCGNDGVYELMVFVDIQRTIPEKDGFVVKEDGGKLYIRYITAVEAEHQEAKISPEGFVGEFGKGGASLAIYHYGFLDADVGYHRFYDVDYYLSVDSFEFGDDVEIDPDEWKDTQIMIYYLSDDDENYHKDEEHTYYRYLYTGNQKYYENDNVFKNTLEEAGFKTYTEKEIQKLLNDRAKEIGLDPAIRND